MAKYSIARTKKVKELLKSLICNNSTKRYYYKGGKVTFTRHIQSFLIEFDTLKKAVEMSSKAFFELAPDDNESVYDVAQRIENTICNKMSKKINYETIK
jgi:hypothetical protein